mgnify:CR=1 FL=1
MKKALIIGAAGFVGQYLIEHLKSLKVYSITVTKLPKDNLESSGIEVFNLDILNQNEVLEILTKIKPDYIFHLAAQSSVALSWENPNLTIDINVKGSINLLNAIRKLDYKPRILMIGSGEEYGYAMQEDIPIKEETILRPGNIYAASKVCQNMIGKIYSKAYDLDIVMVRAFNHVGPKQSSTFVVSEFCRQVAMIEKGLAEQTIKVGNINVRRDFTDVRDVVRAYELLIKYGNSGELYNVGSGQAVSIKNILDLILSKSTRKISICVDKNKFRPADVPIIQADISKLKKTINWLPEYSIERTIEDTLNFWRKNV